VTFYVEMTVELVGEDRHPIASDDVELMADVVMEALVGQPGDLDVAANLGTGELTICGYFPGPTARLAVDQADDVLAAVISGLGGRKIDAPVAFNARPAQLLDA
jgi:hypothetical protein